ncbi:hypothetical protein B0J12DRAFT_563464, partial [Macrophomina phaseolina]
PWTHTPLCMTLGLGEVCTFTSTEFARGRGILIITSPNHAQNISRLTAFLDAESYDNYDDNPAFIEAAIPGRGIGLRAELPIQLRERIMSFTPIVLFNYQPRHQASPEQRLQLEEMAIHQLGHHQQEHFFSLHRTSRDNQIDDIIKNNAFSYDDIGTDTEPLLSLVPEAV